MFLLHRALFRAWMHTHKDGVRFWNVEPKVSHQILLFFLRITVSERNWNLHYIWYHEFGKSIGYTACFIACNTKKYIQNVSNIWFWIGFLSWWSHKDDAARAIIIGCLHNQITSGNCPDDHYATDWFCYLFMYKGDCPLHYFPVENGWCQKFVCSKVLGSVSGIMRYLSSLFQRTKKSHTVRSQACHLVGIVSS